MAGQTAFIALQQVLQKTFEVGEENRLLVNLPRADIRLRAGSEGQIKVNVQAAGASLAKAQQLIERLGLAVRFQGGAVKVETAPLRAEMLASWSRLPSPVFQVEITLPTSCHVDASAHSGTLSAESLEGRIVLSATGGAIRCTDLSGRIELYAQASDVELDRISGERMLVHASGGTLTAKTLETERATLRLSNVDGQLDGIRSATQLHLAGASATAQAVSGELDAESYASDLHIRFDTLEKANLHSVAGDLDLHLPSTLSAQLSLSAPEIDFEPNAAFTGERSDRKVSGSLNGGRATISARSVHGSVVCRVH